MLYLFCQFDTFLTKKKLPQNAIAFILILHLFKRRAAAYATARVVSSFYCTGQSFCIISLHENKENGNWYGNAYCACCKTGIPVINIFPFKHFPQTDSDCIIIRLSPADYLCKDKIYPRSQKRCKNCVNNDRFTKRNGDS